jgi:hypothetical protein
MTHLRQRYIVEQQEAMLHSISTGMTPNGFIDFAVRLEEAVKQSGIQAEKKVMIRTCLAVALAPVLWELDGRGESVFEEEEYSTEATLIGASA